MAAFCGVVCTQRQGCLRHRGCCPNSLSGLPLPLAGQRRHEHDPDSLIAPESGMHGCRDAQEGAGQAHPQCAHPKHRCSSWQELTPVGPAPPLTRHSEHRAHVRPRCRPLLHQPPPSRELRKPHTPQSGGAARHPHLVLGHGGKQGLAARLPHAHIGVAPPPADDAGGVVGARERRHGAVVRVVDRERLAPGLRAPPPDLAVAPARDDGLAVLAQAPTMSEEQHRCGTTGSGSRVGVHGPTSVCTASGESACDGSMRIMCCSGLFHG